MFLILRLLSLGHTNTGKKQGKISCVGLHGTTLWFWFFLSFSSVNASVQSGLSCSSPRTTFKEKKNRKVHQHYWPMGLTKYPVNFINERRLKKTTYCHKLKWFKTLPEWKEPFREMERKFRNHFSHVLWWISRKRQEEKWSRKFLRHFSLHPASTLQSTRYI